MKKAIVCAAMLMLASQAWAGLTVAELRERDDSGDETVIAIWQAYVLGVRDGWLIGFEIDHQEDVNVLSTARDCVNNNNRSLYYKVIDLPEEEFNDVSVSVAVVRVLADCFYAGAVKQSLSTE